MLTDIFAYRYADVPMWGKFQERDRRLIVQAYKIVEDIYPPSVDGKTSDRAQAKWEIIHDKLSTELGHHELSKRAWSYQTTFAGKSYTHSGFWPWDYVCKQYVCKDYQDGLDPDVFIKNRLSFIEIAFRERGEEVNAANAKLPTDIREAELRVARKEMAVGLRVPGSLVDGIKAGNEALNDRFTQQVEELNSRLRQAGYGLNYHNGFIQIATDEKVEQQIETPFWALVAEPRWANVDTDMKEAVDLRDSGGRDPAWHAAKALESTIKIISDEKAWTHGKEKGPHNFIENLANKKNGRFIDAWEATTLKRFFTDVRRPFGHGAGSDEMPKLSDQQTNWAIAFCMAWIRSLVERA